MSEALTVHLKLRTVMAPTTAPVPMTSVEVACLILIFISKTLDTSLEKEITLRKARTIMNSPGTYPIRTDRDS